LPPEFARFTSVVSESGSGCSFNVANRKPIDDCDYVVADDEVVEVLATMTPHDRLRRTRVAALAALALHATAEMAHWVAIMVWAFGEGGAARAGIVSVISMAVSALSAPVFAEWFERMEPVSAYRIGSVAQTAAFAGGSLLLRSNAATPLMVCGAALASATLTVTRPAHYRLLPSLLESPTSLITAARQSRVAELAGTTAGPLLTALALWRSGPASAVAFAGLMVAIGFGCTLLMSPTNGHRDTLSSAAILGEGSSLIRQLRVNPGSIGVLLIGATHFAVLGALDVLTVALATTDGGSESLAGILSASIGFGSLIAATVNRRQVPVLVYKGMALAAAAFLALLCATSVTPRPFFVVSLLIAGGALAVVDAGNRTMLPRSVPSSLLGRVYGLQETALLVGSAIGAIVGPAMVAWLGLSWALVVVGLLPLAMVLAQTRSLRLLDRRGAERGEAVALVANTPLFSGAPTHVVSAIAFAMHRVTFSAGTTLMQQDDTGDCLYFISAGTAEVTIDGSFVRTLGSGAHVGEVALLKNSPRTATVVATTDLTAWQLDSVPFLTAVTTLPIELETLATGQGRYRDQLST
jgi:MFS family permease